MLQFGHGCDAVEMALDWLVKSPLYGLQFGHGCDAVEIYCGWKDHCDTVEASIRPRL